MKKRNAIWLHSITSLGLLAASGLPLSAAVQIQSLRPSHPSGQVIGTTIGWGASATSAGAGRLTFQFNVAAPGGQFVMAQDFNVGTMKNSVWRPAQPFLWTPVGIEGTYQIQVIAKDFATGQSATKTVKFQVKPLVTGTVPVAVSTANPLIALFSAPACPPGSTMLVSFQPQSASVPATTTNSLKCHGRTMTFEIAGMYPTTAYTMFSQTTNSRGSTTNGPPVSFTTGALPSGMPPVKLVQAAGPNTDTNDWMIVHGLTLLSSGINYPKVATDLNGKIVWYYAASSHHDLMTRQFQGGGFLIITDGLSWDPKVRRSQVLKEFDVAGNVVRQTNTGILQQELLALGAVDAGPCAEIKKPAPVGSACLGAFHHEAIRLPNGNTIVLGDIEKIFATGTQGSTMPVDIVGDIMIVLDNNWRPIWYFNSFDHAGGGTQLDVSRPAVLNETCVGQQGGCPPIQLLGTGIAPKANDWLHANSVYYWPQTHDLILSIRHQDWVVRVNYQDTAGDGSILWRMGPGGDFAMNNIAADRWPWFSHQHEVAIESNGDISMFDNGNTRVSNPTGPGSSSGPIPGLGAANCKPIDCDSRGMALSFNETTMQVTPVTSPDLGYYAGALGSAQLLEDGNWFFMPGVVILGANNQVSYSMEWQPNSGAVTATDVLNIQTPEAYRGWQVNSLYNPPAS